MRFRTRRWLLRLSLAFVVIVGAGWLCWPQPRIGPATFNRIRAGMSLQEVSAVIGLPPSPAMLGRFACPTCQRVLRVDDQFAGRTSKCPGCATRVTVPNVLSISLDTEERGIPWCEVPQVWYDDYVDSAQTSGCVQRWVAEDYVIWVAFDESGQAVGWCMQKNVYHLTRPRLLTRVRQWLGW